MNMPSSGPSGVRLPQIGEKWGNFRLDAELGRGPTGIVFRAFDLQQSRALALKVIHPKLLVEQGMQLRLQIELRQLAKLAHANLVPILASQEVNGMVVMTMPLVEGASLDAVLATRKRLTNLEAASCVLQAALALQYAQRQYVTHGDLKLSNLILTNDGVVQVTDLGLARQLGLLAPNAMVESGSPLYFSPERINGTLLDHRSDIYSLGGILYHLVAGFPPFLGGNADILAKHINSQPLPLDRINPKALPQLVALVQTMMAKNPKERHQTYDDLVRDIDAILALQATLPPEEPEPVAPPPSAPQMAAQISTHQPPVQKIPFSPQTVPQKVPSSPSAVQFQLPQQGKVERLPLPQPTVPSIASVPKPPTAPPPSAGPSAVNMPKIVQSAAVIKPPSTPAGPKIVPSMPAFMTASAPPPAPPAASPASPAPVPPTTKPAIKHDPAQPVQISAEIHEKGKRIALGGPVRSTGTSRRDLAPPESILRAASSSSTGLEKKSAAEPDTDGGIPIWKLAVAAIVVVLVVVGGWKLKKGLDNFFNSTSGRTNVADTPPAPTPAPKPSPSPAPAPTPSSSSVDDLKRWEKAINLLSQIDPQKDRVAGNWKFESSALVSDTSTGAVIEIPYRPPEEYDFRIKFIRRSGNDGVEQMLSYKGRAFAWSMANWSNTISLLDTVDGKRNASGNPTETKRDAWFVNGREYTSIVQVRRDGVRAFLDGRQVLDFKTNYNNITPHSGWRLRDDKLLGVGSWGSSVSFTAIQVLEVTGKGAFTRSASSTAMATSSVDNPARWQTAIHMIPLIDPKKDGVGGTWKIENGLLISGEENWARIEIPYQPPDEYDFRIVFTREKGSDAVNQMLSYRGRGFQWGMANFANTIGGFEVISDKLMNNNPTTVKKSPWLTTGTKYSSIVQVRKDGLKAFLDDKLVCEYKTNYSEMKPHHEWHLRRNDVLGVGTFASATTFHTVDLLEISGKGKFLRPDDPAAKEAAKQQAAR